jgi:putative ABC transport system permease protein
VIGNRSRLPFGLLISLRSLIRYRIAPTALATLAIAASVALAASTEMASRSVRREFEHTAAALIGRAQIEVTAGAAGVPEALLEELRSIPGVAAASPMIRETFRIASPGYEGEAIHVVGVDLLSEREVRDFDVLVDGFEARDLLRLVALPDSMIVSSALARRLELSEGASLALRSRTGEHTLTVRGILSGALADAYGAQVVAMDVFALQQLVGMENRFERIDITLSEGMELAQMLPLIEERVAGKATARESNLRRTFGASMLAMLDLSLWAVVIMSISVSLFTTYGIISLMVIRRSEEISLLRAAGMEARRALRLIVTDAALMAVLGTAVGAIAALLLAGSLFEILSRASLRHQQVAIRPAGAAASTFAVAFLVSIPTGLLASLGPARRAGRIRPLELLDEYRASGRRSGRTGRALAVGMTALACLVLVPLGSGILPAHWGIGIAVVAGIISMAATSGPLLVVYGAALQSIMGRVIPRVGYLVAPFLVDRPFETGVTIAVWGGVISSLVAALIAIESATSSIGKYAAGLQGNDGILVLAEDPLASRMREPIWPSTLEAIRTTPGVIDIADYYNLKIRFRGEEINVGNLPTDLLEQKGVEFLSRDPDGTLAALRSGELVMSESFARYFGVAIGDVIALETKEGPRHFRVGGWAMDFSGPTGSLHLDTKSFQRWFDQPYVSFLALWVTEPQEEVLVAIRERASSQALFFRSAAYARRHAEIVVSRFRALLLVPVGLVSSLGVLALLNLLVGNVLARRRELSLIRAAGATAANVASIVILNGCFVAALGAIWGIGVGHVWALAVCEALADHLGWIVDLRVDGWRSLAIAGAGIALAALAGFVTILVSRRREPADLPSLG